MTPTVYLWDARSLDHDTGYHVECIARAERLRPERIALHVANLDARPVIGHETVTWIGRVHEPAYHDWVRVSCERGRSVLDQGDTVVCERSYASALASVDSALTAADLVMSGEATCAFSAMRPPGHHARPHAAMGFCLFGNIAILARYLQRAHGVERIAIVDWDVHHGNGTQEILYEDSSVLFVSLHQHPLWPGTGLADERGRGPGEGFTLNLPIAPFTSEKDYLARFEREAAPAVDGFRPQVILISAGFDAHRADPLAQLQLTEEAFAAMTRRLKAVAARHCDGRIISLLEGGYDLDALEASAAAHVAALME